MTEITPLRPLVPAQAPTDPEVLPHNIEAEQQLLGAILTNNRAYERVAEYLAPEHFADPVHGRIFEAAGRRIGREEARALSPERRAAPASSAASTALGPSTRNCPWSRRAEAR